MRKKNRSTKYKAYIDVKYIQTRKHRFTAKNKVELCCNREEKFITSPDIGRLEWYDCSSPLRGKVYISFSLSLWIVSLSPGDIAVTSYVKMCQND